MITNCCMGIEKNMYAHAMKIIQCAIDSVKPERLISSNVTLRKNYLKIKGHTFDLSEFNKIYLLGAGKAVAYMAHEIEKKIQNIEEGLVIVKYGHSKNCKKVKILEAGHPIIDENSLSATQRLLDIALKAKENDLVIFLLSGGGSSLLEKPIIDVSINELKKVFELLINSGADISEINTVRKHLSSVKGGGLARLCYPAKLLSLIISDVIGDRLDVIASGPTIWDSSTFEDAFFIIKKFNLLSAFPVKIIDYLKQGAKSKSLETLKEGDEIFKNVKNIILGNNSLALEAANKKALDLGFKVHLIDKKIYGDVSEVSKIFAQKIKDLNSENNIKNCIIAGGETTVKVKGTGKGGRNQHLALSVLNELRGAYKDYLFLSVGTDGTDGPTDAAGAFVTNETYATSKNYNLSINTFLKEFDSYNFFKQTKSLIKTGPTGTNVMDIMIAIA